MGASGTAITAHYSGTAAFDAASITAGDCAAAGTITATGAAVGDTVYVSPTATGGGMETLHASWFGYVSASNIVTIRVCANQTSDAGTQTWRADVWAH